MSVIFTISDRLHSSCLLKSSNRLKMADHILSLGRLVNINLVTNNLKMEIKNIL